ncbi:MAG: SDR family NAD(P)-dependent oxidoreductase, partial [Gammaproteobacteria bacterium]
MQSTGGAGAAVLHCEGELARQPSPAPARLPLETAANGRVEVSVERLYAALGERGIDYGPAFRAVRQLYVGEEELFARLVIPDALAPTLSAYGLHPSLMDAALHAVVGFDVLAQERQRTSTPPATRLLFAVKEITLTGPCSPEMWVHIRRNRGAAAHGGAAMERLDVDVSDAAGQICIRLRGAASRIAAQPPQGALGAATGAGRIVQLVPGWEPVHAAASSAQALCAPTVVCGASEAQRRALAARWPDARFIDAIDPHAAPMRHLVWLAPEVRALDGADEALIDAQQAGVLALFRQVKALAASGYGSAPLRLSVVTIATQAVPGSHETCPVHAGVHGLAGALAREYPLWSIDLLDIDANAATDLADLVERAPSARPGQTLAWRDQVWYRTGFALAEEGERAHGLYRHGGVYVVIGGAGTLGETWSRHMIERHQARIVWIGRRALDHEIQGRIDALGRLGPAPLYLSADATDRAALQEACDTIKRRYGKIDGIVHSAAGMLGKPLADMDEERFREAFAAKVDVSVRLAQVFGPEQLDFVLYFSSIVSFVRNGGQSSYAAGSAFADAHALQLGRAWRCPIKIMNWGYLGGGVVAASEGLQRWMADHGMGSIEASEALDCLDRLLPSPHAQMIAMKVTSAAGLHDMAPQATLAPVGAALPVTLPAVEAHARAAAAATPVGPLTRHFHDADFDALMLRIMQAHLRSLGQEGASSALLPKYQRWLDESRRLLAGLPAGAAGAGLDLDGLWHAWQGRAAQWHATPGLQAKAVLAEKTLRALPEILAGATRATDILFPGSSLDLVQGIYKDNPVSDYYNEIVAQAVLAHVRQRVSQQPGARVRILEIGAGTGGTSATVFARLRGFEGSIERYAYTDLSRAFLLHAEEHYRGIAPYLHCQVLDIEKPVEQQGIEAGSYDVIIAANVLHATGDMLRTMDNAKVALKENGLIVLNEMSCNSVFAHLTFGLLDGWWLYQDGALRMPGCPGLAPGQWKQVLALGGWRHALFPAEAGHGLGQQVIVAESDGVLRRPLARPLAIETAAPAAAQAPVRPPAPTPTPQPQPRQEAWSQARIATVVREKLVAALRVAPETIDAD